jgi:hypothetical protein
VRRPDVRKLQRERRGGHRDHRGLDTVGLVGAARVTLVLQLDVEIGEGGIQPFHLGELRVHTLGEVLRKLYVPAGDLDLGLRVDNALVRCFMVVMHIIAHTPGSC